MVGSRHHFDRLGTHPGYEAVEMNSSRTVPECESQLAMQMPQLIASG